MDRKIEKGFTLVELIVVAFILGILMLIGIPQIVGWMKKYNIESDTKKIYSIIQTARQKAFSEKIKLDISISGTKICFKCDNNDNDCKSSYGTGNIVCKDLNYTFSGNTINVSNRGTLSGGPIWYPSKNDAPIDCVVVSNLRVKMGKCNGTKP